MICSIKTPGLDPSLQQSPGMKDSMLPNSVELAYQDIVYNDFQNICPIIEFMCAYDHLEGYSVIKQEAHRP